MNIKRPGQNRVKLILCERICINPAFPGIAPVNLQNGARKYQVKTESIFRPVCYFYFFIIRVEPVIITGKFHIKFLSQNTESCYKFRVCIDIFYRKGIRSQDLFGQYRIIYKFAAVFKISPSLSFMADIASDELLPEEKSKSNTVLSSV